MINLVIFSGRGTGAISEMNVETVFSVSDRTDAMTVTMTDEGPELPPGTAGPNGNQSEVKFCLILPLKSDKNG